MLAGFEGLLLSRHAYEWFVLHVVTLSPRSLSRELSADRKLPPTTNSSKTNTVKCRSSDRQGVLVSLTHTLQPEPTSEH